MKIISNNKHFALIYDENIKIPEMERFNLLIKVEWNENDNSNRIFYVNLKATKEMKEVIEYDESEFNKDQRNPFLFRFRLKIIEKKFTIKFDIKTRKDGRVISDIVELSVNVINPFYPLRYEQRTEENGITERDSALQSFNRFLNQHVYRIGDLYSPDNRHVVLVVGPPGIGKTVFLEQWRRREIGKGTPPYPIILIARPELTSHLNAHKLIYFVDKSIYDSIQKARMSYFDLLDKEVRLVAENVLNECKPLLKHSISDYQVNAFGYHKEFTRKIDEFVNKLTNFKEFQSKNANKNDQIRRLIVLDIDEIHQWEPEYMGSLINSMLDFKTISGFMIVIVVRYPFQVLFAKDRNDIDIITAFNRFFSEQDLLDQKAIQKQDSNLPSFTLPVLNEKQIGRILTKRLSQVELLRWWDDTLFRYLQYCTGGNPQALESILYHWWNYITNLPLIVEQKTPSSKSAFQKQENLIQLSHKDKLESLKNAVIRGEQNVVKLRNQENYSRREEYKSSLCKLWDTYKEILPNSPERKKEYVKHLQTIARHQERILTNEKWTISEIDWYTGMPGDGIFREYIVHDLERLRVIEKITHPGGNYYRLEIPALCVPINNDIPDKKKNGH